MTDATTNVPSDQLGPQTPSERPIERAMRYFIHDLERLRDNRAALAALRSGLGKDPGTVIAMYPYVGPHLRPDGGDGARLAPWDKIYNDALFTVASLFGAHPFSRTGEGNADNAGTTTVSGRNSSVQVASEPSAGTPKRQRRHTFLDALRVLRTNDQERDQALDRRVTALLNVEREGLPTLLRQAVRLLGTDEVPIDWLQLLRDLNHWDDEDRPVQKRWASAWWTAPARADIANTTDAPSESGATAGTTA